MNVEPEGQADCDENCERIGSGFTRRREAAKFRLEKDNSCHILIHYQSDMGETEQKK